MVLTGYGSIASAVEASAAAVHKTPDALSLQPRLAPILHDEALQAQSAQIDTVSGATYTSEGYVASLQSALDQAGILATG